MIVSIADSLVLAIQKHARDARPCECCGLLTGYWADETLHVDAVHPSENLTSGDATRTFEVDPKLRFDLMRDEEKAGSFPIVGHYHSHPSGEAFPSETDLKMAYEAHFIWLICGQTADLRAFRPRPDRTAFDTLTLEVTV
jgi:proteasome lid subunit RPN8/RPN11